MATIIDLTHTFTASMPVPPFDEPSTLSQTRTLANDSYNDWRLCSGMHAGTHIDGPGHVTDSHTLLSSLPIDRFVGTGHLIDARNKMIIEASAVQELPDQEGLIVLFLTGRDKQFGAPAYFTNHPIMSKECAKALVAKRVNMVGIDCYSPDTHPFPVHQILLAHNILIIENLTNLDLLTGKTFTVAALPLKTATDSSLARVIAWVQN